MSEMTPVTVDVSETDLADLQEWARNSEQSVGDLLKEALRHYMEYVRADHADLEDARQGPSYTLDEVKAHLMEHRAQSRRDYQAEAAE